MLLERKYGMIILDEAHKARARAILGGEAAQPNNLLVFMQRIAQKTRHMILGTATPIQTNVRELWDLMGVLGTGADFVIGDLASPWRNHTEAIPVMTGNNRISTVDQAWEWLRNPLPPHGENDVVTQLRDMEGIGSQDFFSATKREDLEYLVCENVLPQCLGQGFFKDCNPLIRHVILRKRKDLEDAGLLERVGVTTHPLLRKDGKDLYKARFSGLGISTNRPFEVAYEKAEEFCHLLQVRTKVGGFMKTLMLQRICSSFASGLKTAQRMLKHSISSEEEDDVEEVKHILSGMSPGEVECLREIEAQLSRPEAVDSKLATVKWFLTEFKTDEKTWLEHGCIIFTQYFDTAEWVAKELAAAFPQEVVAVYAGVGKSGIALGDQFNAVTREQIKSAVKKREIRLVVATDAACEGLNLQTLGTLINIDLPWNPSRLEQRLGRIKRFGQARKTVDMLNLVYSDTQDEKIYSVLSERLKDTHDIFGSLPDTIDDEWIQDISKLREEMDAYIHRRQEAQNAFSLRYKESVQPDSLQWERCSQVLSRRDITEKLSEPWK